MKLLLPVLILLCGNKLLAQPTAPAAENVVVHADSAVNAYYKFTSPRARLYNGREFIRYSPKLEGQPFYSDDELHRGTVIYDGMKYDSVNMQYDLVRDNLVIQHFDIYFKLVLVPEKLTEFSYIGHHFKRLVKDSVNKLPVATGIYDFLHEGKITLFAKRTKRIEETVTDVIVQRVTEKNFYYIIKDDVYYPVKSYKGLLAVLKDRSREIRQELRRQKIKFRKDREGAIIKAVEFYDTPKN
ncbi:MAG: hypothetical protein ABW036_07105 [Flavitalea sp.]